MAKVNGRDCMLKAPESQHYSRDQLRSIKNEGVTLDELDRLMHHFKVCDSNCEEEYNKIGPQSAALVE